MRYDRGTVMIGRWNAKPGMPVWAPDAVEKTWQATVITFVSDDRAEVYGWDLMTYVTIPLWQLRVRDPYKAGRDKPDEPAPPTLGKPKANAAKVRMGIMTNGDIKGP